MEQIEHEVIVDDNIIVKLKIPKILTAMELKALSMKADKLFKLSDATMPRTFSNTKGTAMFSAEQTEDIVIFKEAEKLNYEQITEKLNKKYGTNFIKKSVQSRYYNARDKYRK